MGFAVRFVGVEVLLWGAGMMFMPAPQVVVLVMAFGAFLLLAERLSRGDALATINDRFRESILRLEATPKAVPWWLSASISALLLLIAGPFAEAQLWKSGNFGEPPFNRFVRFHDLHETAVVEFGVRLTPIEGYRALIHFTNPVKDELGNGDFWLCDANNPIKPENPHDVIGFICGGNANLDWLCSTNHMVRITPAQSVCVTVGRLLAEIDECVFSKVGGAERFCSSDIELVNAPSRLH